VITPTKTVRVTKTGNSRALPLPAEMAKSAGLDVGDSVEVELRDGVVTYRLDAARALIVGSGRGRAGMVPRGRALALADRSLGTALDTWDF
jgi:bifunctional DNA-binding transcriptional regulator/antitoxin component of YhaV-PrlF toxin-antitoxin module